MRSTMWFALVLGLSSSLGCSLVFDGGKHRGGDLGFDGGALNADGGESRDGNTDSADSSLRDSGAPNDASPDTGAPDSGCPDRDNDGYTDTACGGSDCDDTREIVYPGAPPICDNGLVERCPGDPRRVTLSDYGDTLTSAGVLPTITLVAEPGELDPKFGMALGGASSGSGTAMVVAMVRDGSFNRPRRVDVDLDSSGAPLVVPLIGETGTATNTADLSTIATLKGVDVRRLSTGVLGLVMIGNSDVSGLIGWRGTVDLRSDTQDLNWIRAQDTSSIGYGEPAVLGYFGLWRESGSPTLLFGRSLQDPPALVRVDTDIPVGEARVVSTSGQHALLQRSDGELCFFGADGAPFVCANWANQRGPAAFERLASGYLLSIGVGGDLQMITYECSSSTSCRPAPRVSAIPVLASGADSSAAFDMAPLPNGNGLLLFVANHPDGDILYLQPILPQGGAGGDRIELISMRGENLRVADAELDLVTNADGISVAVVATIKQNFAAMADSMVLTGLRGCNAD